MVVNPTDVMYYSRDGGLLWVEDFLPIQKQDKVESLTKCIGSNEWNLPAIKVSIGDNGEVILIDGAHRTCAAYLLGISEMPAKVLYRHGPWHNFRFSLWSIYKKNHMYHRLDHPDLSSWTYWRDDVKERAKIISDAIGDKFVIVDVGCNLGGLTVELSRLGHYVNGVDIDEKMLKNARRWAKVSGQDCKFTKRITHRYGYVVALSVIHHQFGTEDEYRLLRECAGMACFGIVIDCPKKGGAVAGSDPRTEPAEMMSWIVSGIGGECKLIHKGSGTIRPMVLWNPSG